MISEAPQALDRARDVLRGAHAVTPSRSLLRLEDTIRRGDATTRQLAQFVEASPALAARVLRMANSSFYAPLEPVLALGRAVPMLGHTVLRQLVLATLVLSRQEAGRSTRRGVAAARLSGNAVRSAVVSRALAAESRLCDPDEAFSAGLLHDLGHFHLLDATGDAYATYLVDESPANPLERELQLTGTTHELVGVAFAYDWNLPSSLASVIAEHHSSEPESLAAIVAASDVLLAEAYRLPTDGPGVAIPASAAALESIGMDRAAWDAIEPGIRADYAELLTVFDRFG